MGDFRADREGLGRRLGRQRELGPTGLARLYVDAPEVKPDLGAGRLPAEKSNQAAAEAGPRKVGRPKVEGVKAWEAEGISRAAWFRRKKAGK